MTYRRPLLVDFFFHTCDRNATIKSSFHGLQAAAPETNTVWRYYALMPEHVYSTGRAGSYRYGLDIDDCIEQAMLMAQQIKEGGRDYPVPVKEWR